MALVIKNVAIAGTSGNVGSHALQAIVEQGRFTVTVLARKQPAQVPAGVVVKIVDFDSVPSLTKALKGQDAFVDTINTPDPMRALPPFLGKAKVYDYIREQADAGQITWTAISNNAFLDWGLRVGFLNIDLINKKVALMNDGMHPFPWTKLSFAGKAVAGVLAKPEETKNRVCHVYNFQKNQRDMAELAKQALGDEGWQTERLDMDEVFAKALSDLKSGKVDFQVIGDMIRYAITTPSLASPLDKDDNELLGVPALSDDDIKQLIKEIAAETK